jgi:glycosyltransferase involved in cell wall biosynthesis
MRIGIDGGCLANRRGFGRFAREILAALGRSGTGHEVLVFVDRPSLDDPLVAIPAGFRAVPVEVREAPSRAASATGRRSVSDLLAMSRAAARERLDALYFPASYSFFPVWKSGRVVVTIFDTLPLAHPDLVFPNRRGRLLWTLKERAAVAWADHVLTTSEASRADLVRWYKLDPSRVGLISAGPDACFRPAGVGASSDAVLRKYGLDPGERYLLYVGGLSPHKNLPRLVEAFGRGAPPSARLVLVGDPGDVFHTHLPEIQRAIAATGRPDRVLMPGYVPDAELIHLYSRAYALVQPSLMEGFGLPAVEAMACGTPVLSSTAGSLPEVVGDAGAFFDPARVGSIEREIAALLSDPARRDRLADRALARSRQFSWDRAARQLLEALEMGQPSAHSALPRPHTAKLGEPAKL